jgi:hypothetical protein
MERSKRFIARFAVAALSMTMMVAMFAGTAYAAASTNETKGQGPGDADPTGTPAYTWAGSNFSVDLSITTNATSNVKQYALIFNGPGVCSLSDADTVLITGAGECVVSGRVNSGNTYSASTDEMEISISKGTQATLTAAASPSSAVYNQTVNLSTTGGTTGGSVTYIKQSGDCSVNSGAATATVTALSSPAEDCVVEATMAGNSNYEEVLDEVTISVSKATQAAFTVSASDETVTYGEGTVTLTPSGGSGTGAVSYSVAGGCTNDGATVTITSGTTDCVATATKAADDNYLEATDDVTISVSKDEQSAFTVSASDETVTYGEGTVTLTPAGGSGTGAVSYSVTGGCTNDGATVTITSGTTNCVATATKAADNDYLEASDDVTITVSKATQASLQVLTDNADGTTATYASPNGTVTLTDDGGGSGTGGITYSKVSGDCTVSGSTATITGGTNDCVVRATSAADENYLVETDDATITVSKATQAALLAKTDDTDGTSAGFDTTVALTSSGGSGTGTVTYAQISGDCTVADSTATITGVTTECVVEATKAADNNYLEETDQVTITVTKATQAPLIALTDGTDGTIAYLTTVALTSSGGSGDGAVTFAKVSGSCTVSGSTATITGITNNCIVEATKAANDSYYVITDRVTIIVTKQAQAALTALTDSANGTTVTYGQSTSVALSTSGGTGTGAVSYAKISGDCTVAGSTATITGYTTNCVVEATKAADNSYLEATDQVTITVAKAAQATLQVLTDDTDGTSAIVSETVNLTTTGGSGGGGVIFSKVSGDCTVAGSVATITGSTTDCVVRATSAADDGHLVATDDATITVSPAVTLPTTSVSPTVRKASRNATVTNSGTWAANGGTLSAATYQWYQCTSAKSAVAAASSINAPGDCVVITGATTSTWRIAGVSRRYLRVLVTRSNAAGSAYAWSATFRR